MQKAFGKKSVIFLFIFPAFLIYTAFVIVSIVWAGYYSFFDWSGVGEKVFVGFKNYIELLTQDDVFRSTVWHTLIYTVINVAIQVFGGLLFAILLSRIKKGRVALQTLYYIPVVISSVAICQIFTKLLSVTPTGIVNQVLSFIDPSLKLMEWISNPQISLYVTAFVEAYKYLGLYMVIFYAALIGVPDELGEAALIDGASTWQEYLYVRIPYIKPVIIANCLLVLNGSLRSFEFSYLLTHGGPGNASELMTTYMYKQAFSSMKYGYGSSVAIMIVIICMVVGMLFRKFTGGGDDEMKKKKTTIPSIIKWVIALILVVMQVYPFFYVFTSSFKSLDDFRQLPAYALPSKWVLTNFINVFTKSHMLTYFKNSIIVLIGVLIPLLLFALMAGFALSKIKFKGRKFVLNYFLLGLMLPMQVALIPLFTIFNKMGLINTYPAIILPQIAFSLSYSIQLFYSFSKFFPEEMLEAAIIDGCSPIGCFFKMVVPMSLNSIITVATMQAVFCWNEYINAYTFTRSTDMKTITLGLNDFVGSMGLTDWGGTFAAITVTVLPVFIFYFFSSKKMLAGMTAGAVKG